jgi:2-polyprenyl-3-methyl-5-hydroxy-6-metoxy-1,4-benzoquinol methylase
VSKLDWPSGGLEYLGYCPVCGSELRKLQYADLKDHLYAAPGSWTLHRCMECQVRYLDPRPNVETIGLAYSTYHTHGTVSQYKIQNNPLRKAKLALKNGYLNNVWNTSFHPAYPSLARLITKIYPRWMALYNRQTMRDLPNPASGELLDIGCGSGSFLRLAKAVGWSVHGIDFDGKALDAAAADKIDVRLGGVELFDGQKELFDVITLSHVIEHVHDPKILLKACWTLLKPGGTFWIEAPNFDSYGRKLFGRNWRGLEPPRHLVLFNTASISKLLAEIGFKNVQHAEWMPQHKPMYQASKNIKNGDTAEVKNLNIYEKIKIAIADRKLKKDVSSRELFTFIGNK